MTSALKSFAICLTTAAALAGGFDVASVNAEPYWLLAGPVNGELEDTAHVRLVAENCSSAASRAASETGGQVLSVSMRRQGGQTVCVVTVLVPARDGERPRKKTVTIKP
jgi:hypothetical protein